MMKIEGRVLGGLDEFMLRVGHLVTICRVAHEIGGSWARIHREAAARLAMLVVIEPARNGEVARYLAAKNLCRQAEAEEDKSGKRRDYLYPELEVYSETPNELAVRNIETDEPVRVSWQDSNLADPRVRSRVGALTWSAKSGSKTGLSHVCDWAEFLELVDSTGQLSPMGRLLVTLTGVENTPFEKWNPYVLGAERVILAYQYLQKDIDLFARLAPLLLRAPHPLTKATCRALFVEALQQSVSDADVSKTVPSHRSFELAQQIRDLERSARRSKSDMKETSTAWHRAASRVEVLTDLGWLEKGGLEEMEKYKYLYSPTEQLAYVVETLERAETGDEWIEEYIVATVLGDSASNQQSEEGISEERLLAGLNTIVRALRLPTTQFPIDCLVLGLAYLNAGIPVFQPLRSLRKLVEAIPAKYPSVARLARGREGTRAEYLSLNLRGLAEI